MEIESIIEKAKKARENAYAPYSGIKIGTAILTKSGKTFTGCNIENASYGLTICAEMVAIANAISEGEREFELLVIASDDFAYPCGACRQVLIEFSGDIKIILVNEKGDIIDTTIKKLLPHPFHISRK
ncbi:cytidine deaminase [candidate division WOR-3 bacterium]|nr:cytidine deaminase [candidate division WOR-3 bacterium]